MDEEKNNNGLGKKALDMGKQEVKEQAKKKILPKIIAFLAPILGTIFVALLIIGVILLVITTIISAIKSFLGLDSNSTTTVEQSAQAAIYLSEDGKNYIINEEYIDNIVNSLQEQAVDTDAAGLTDTKDKNGNVKEKMLRKYVKAEVKTLYPKIGSSDIDGLVEIQRDNGQDGSSSRKLTYLPYETLKSYVSNNDTDSKNYFSLNPDTFKLCFTTVQINQIYDENGEKVSDVPNVMLNEVDYQYLVSQYAMPSNFTISTHFIAQDDDFMNDLLDLVEKDSKIVITLKDTVTTTTTEINYTGTVYEKLDETAYFTDNNSEKSAVANINKQYDINNQNISTYYDQIGNFKEVSTNTSTELVVTEADTWIANRVDEYEKTIKTLNQDPLVNEIKNPEEDGQYYKVSEETITDLDGYSIDSELEKEIKLKSSGSADLKINSINIVTNRRLDITETTEQTIENTEYNSINQDTNLNNIQKIIDLINEDKYKKVKKNFTTSEEFYFKLLNSDEKTQNIEQVMRYVLYKLTGKDYGVTDIDGLVDLYEQTSFTVVGGGGIASSDLLIQFIHYFEHSTPPPTNADGTKYIIENDGAGNAVVGYGVDIENSGYKSLFIQEGYPTTVGGEVDKDFVDSIEQMVLENKSAGIKSALSGLNLTNYQLNALVSRAYNCGTSGAIEEVRNGKNFVQAYNTYWNQENDDYFEKKNPNANFNHQLYTKYMKDPVTSKGQFLIGLEKRRKSEWTLFQTGYYDVLNQWDSDASGGSIIEVAKSIHEYMENNGYTYCVYGGNSYEECNGGGHGLNTTFEQSKSGFHHSCCATFVSWVLQQAGCISDSDHSDSANGLQAILKGKGFITINNENELQAGDVLCYDHHVEIYAGNNTIYNAGSGNSIRAASPQNRTRRFNYALRAPTN